MRVYLAATIPQLRAWLEAGAANPPIAFAVTPALREHYSDGDIEELEYAAQRAAARHGLRLIATEGDAPPRRVVLAADIGPDMADPTAALSHEPAAVGLLSPLPRSSWASALVDDPADVEVVAAAVAVVLTARSDDDQDRLDDAEACELMWFGIQELSELVAE